MSHKWIIEGSTVYQLMHSGWRKGEEQFKNAHYFRVEADKEAPQSAEDVARRLVACWNICDGIETEDLESAMSISDQPLRENVMHSALLVEDNNRLISERAELVSAATKILDAVMDNASVPLELILGLKDALDKVKS